MSETSGEFAVRDPLERWLAARLPGRGARVENLRKPGTGMSSDTLLFELRESGADGSESARACVLRCLRAAARRSPPTTSASSSA